MSDKKTAVDMINHPPHYLFKNGIETIDVIEAFTEGLSGAEAVNTAHVIRYISRWKNKNGLEDLKKAQFYINRLVEQVEKKEQETHDKLMMQMSQTTTSSACTTAANAADNQSFDEIVKIFNT